MFTIPEEVRTSLLPTKMSIQNKTGNFSLFIATEFTEVSQDPEYEQFLADVWVGIVLTLMVLSCVCCMCSCLLYHKFQQWKRSVIEARHASDLENGYRAEMDALPSYTVASGLPSYEEALEQLKLVKERAPKSTPQPPPPKPIVQRLSVTDLFQIYRTSTSNSASAATSSKS